jgi:hypothetical protein
MLGAALAVFAAGSASATVRISGDPGGQIGAYMMQYMLLRESGERVVIDGPCMSACTLVLSLIPRERICVTERALLGFHAAWTPDYDGRPLPSWHATQMLFSTYPRKVKSWIRRNGGLTPRTIALRGRELASMYRRCGEDRGISETSASATSSRSGSRASRRRE